VGVAHKLFRDKNNMQGTQIDPNTGFLDRYSCLQLASDMVEEVGETLTSLLDTMVAIASYLWLQIACVKRLMAKQKLVV
jgi:hypothetical protein